MTVNPKKIRSFQDSLHVLLPFTQQVLVAELLMKSTNINKQWTRRQQKNIKFFWASEIHLVSLDGLVGIWTRGPHLARVVLFPATWETQKGFLLLYRWATSPHLKSQLNPWLPLLNWKCNSGRKQQILDLLKNPTKRIFFSWTKKNYRRWSHRRFPYGDLVTT
jgi:hypothetical protein